MSQATNAPLPADTPTQFDSDNERRELESLLHRYQQQLENQENKINQLEERIKNINNKKERSRGVRRKIDTEIDSVAKSISGNGITNLRPSAKEVAEIEKIKERRAKDREERRKRDIRWRGKSESDADCSNTNSNN